MSAQPRSLDASVAERPRQSERTSGGVIEPLASSELPLELPEVEDYKPTGNPEPPLGKATVRGPKITESRYTESPPGSKECKVGFWNLTGRDVTLLVDGHTHFLQKDHAVTLDLGRQFTWEMDKGEPRNVQVPADQHTHEIVLRPRAGR